MGANKSKLSAKGPPLCNTGGIITTLPRWRREELQRDADEAHVG